MGGGSNLVFIDDFDGIILVNEIKGISYFDIESYYYLCVGVGENWYDFVILCMKEKWYGFENFVLIFGLVGVCLI